MVTTDQLKQMVEAGQNWLRVKNMPVINHEVYLLKHNAEKAFMDDITEETIIALAEELIRAREALAHLRGLVSHWNEFGHEYGLDEMMGYAYAFLRKGDGSAAIEKAKESK